MDKKYLQYIAFKGINPLSQIIKKYTRSEYSHIAYVLSTSVNQDNFTWFNYDIIEVWNHNGGIKDVWWDYSNINKHSKGTNWERWGLLIEKNIHQVIDIKMNQLAIKKYPYDWPGVFGFLLKGLPDKKDGLFCSEGCIEPLCEELYWNKVVPSQVSPVDFVRFIQVAGGVLLEEGNV